MFVITNILLALVAIVHTFLTVYSFIVIASVIISWVNPDPRNPVVRILRLLTEPVYEKIRNKTNFNFPFLDIAPTLVILVLFFIKDGILPSIAQFAAMLGQ